MYLVYGLLLPLAPLPVHWLEMGFVPGDAIPFVTPPFGASVVGIVLVGVSAGSAVSPGHVTRPTFVVVRRVTAAPHPPTFFLHEMRKIYKSEAPLATSLT